MFKLLRIRNHKSHEDTLINFHKGVNVFFGLGQSGKTNIIRALKLVFTNRPRGGEYLSHFAGKKDNVDLNLITDDGHDISLRKQIRIDKHGDYKVLLSEYKLNGESFESGNEVPDEVVRALNISEINIHEQLDQPFLVTSSGGEVARTINRITKLEKVDEWLKKLTQKINAVNRDISSVERRIGDADSDLEAFSDFDETKELVRRYEKIISKKSDLTMEHYHLDLIISSIEGIEEDITNLSRYLEVENDIKDIDELGGSIDLLYEELELIDDVLELEESVKELESSLDVEEYITRLEEINNEIVDLEREEMLIDSTSQLDADSKILERDLYDIKLEIDGFIDELGGICPILDEGCSRL